MLSENGRVTLLGVFLSLIMYYTMSVDIKNEIKDFEQQVSNEFKNVNTRLDQLSDILEKKK